MTKITVTYKTNIIKETDVEIILESLRQDNLYSDRFIDAIHENSEYYVESVEPENSDKISISVSEYDNIKRIILELSEKLYKNKGLDYNMDVIKMIEKDWISKLEKYDIMDVKRAFRKFTCDNSLVANIENIVKYLEVQ
jgi:hypothetical protein